jgi:hypothetical protein
LKSEVNKERGLASKEQVEIQKLTRQVQELKQEQTEIAALKARLDRLEAGESTTLTARSSHASKGKQSSQAEIARARF